LQQGRPKARRTKRSLVASEFLSTRPSFMSVRFSTNSMLLAAPTQSRTQLASASFSSEVCRQRDGDGPAASETIDLRAILTTELRSRLRDLARQTRLASKAGSAQHEPETDGIWECQHGSENSRVGCRPYRHLASICHRPGLALEWVFPGANVSARASL
jgi:hypothetical protein